MIPANPFLAALVLGAGMLGLGAFFAAVFKGLFDDPGAQALSLFDGADLRIRREWETPAQQDERRRSHGGPVAAAPGEWGGSR